MTQSLTMKSFDNLLFLRLFIAFIAFTIIGTTTHELGHYVVAKSLGYPARINYAATNLTPKTISDIASSEDRFYITLGGPIQTILTGTIGFLLLIFYRKSYYSSEKLNWRQWFIILIALFWLRQPANFTTWTGNFLITGQHSTKGDEIKIANYLELPGWSIVTLTAIVGLVLLAAIVFKFIPKKQRLTFLFGGFAGGITGYVLWIVLLGKFIMP